MGLESGPASKGSVSLAELGRAFTSMLPGRGDVLLNSRAPADAAIFVESGIFTLKLSDIGHPSSDANLIVEMPTIERQFAASRIPLPSQMFAGAWLRFDNAFDVKIVHESARLLVPGALMAIVSSAQSKLQ